MEHEHQIAAVADLGIRYAEKTRLMIEGGRLEEVERREADPAYLARRVIVHLAHGESSDTRGMPSAQSRTIWRTEPPV